MNYDKQKAIKALAKRKDFYAPSKKAALKHGAKIMRKLSRKD